jgi:hypothetical protein
MSPDLPGLRVPSPSRAGAIPAGEAGNERVDVGEADGPVAAQVAGANLRPLALVGDAVFADIQGGAGGDVALVGDLIVVAVVVAGSEEI